MTGSTGLSRPSSGQGNRRDELPSISKNADDSVGVGDESMSLSSPTSHLHPGHKEVRKSGEMRQEGHADDVSMEEDEEAEEDISGPEDKLTSEMNADERREKLRRRTSRKGEEEAAE